ncbi:MAG: CsbD family protein [Ornithinimicrobium sp.]|uniref:CsbD family protein n=1 Tax=Ornithinimicrobium sp. TaxID=1977084 RepID=UPI0026DECE9E|nr:CsbD family protein [Ornithinimicrobium sp.]MDO5738548.1 CsbD family protein [Ornithinimicrobium sp.]
MGMGDKISNAAEEAKGKAKEHIGDATDNASLEAEGHMDQAEANVKQSVEKGKDAFKDATDR